MNLIKPNPLKIGDTIAIIAPSGPVEFEPVSRAKQYFEAKGYRVKLGEHLFDADRYLAGCDEARVEDLHNAFADKEINAIICARGGYGAIRLIKLIDFELIKNNPKIFCGYSDVTLLSALFLKYANLITYSSPMAVSDFANDSVNEVTESSFFKVLGGEKDFYMSKTTYSPGKAEGIIWGGNLSTVVSLCGIDFIPDSDFIFFAEDVNEPVYKLDKMLNQLINIKKFRENIKGIAFGEFSGVDDEAWLEALLTETSEILSVPSYGGFKFTHASEKQTIPYGGYAVLDGSLNLY